MKQLLKRAGQVFTGAATAATIFAGRAMATSIGDIENPAQAGADAARANGVPTQLVGVDGVFGRFTSTVLFAVGIIAVIMLIWGGLKYAISNGDSKKVTEAKNTIIYAIIGLIISVLAYAIVNFVISTIGTVTE